MVEHAWVRIAEIKEEAIREEWEQQNPRRVWLQKAMRRLRIRAVNHLIDFLASERGKKMTQHKEQLRRLLLRFYLRVTRVFGCRPKRSYVLKLSTKQLIDEMDDRGLDHDECVEKSDLLDALCGAVASGDDAGDEHEALVPPTPVDKMV